MNPEQTATDRPADRWSRNPALTTLAEKLQPVVRNLLAGSDGARRPLSDLLHGTFLGHPLHPLMTDIPIGSWTVAAVFDALELGGAQRFTDAADAAILFGALGAVGAAATGLADWSDTADEPQRAGMLHAILNSAALACYGVSLVTRKAGARKLGIATAFAGYGVMTAAAFLGGELSFGMQLGVKHTAVPIDAPAEFQSVLDAAALPAGDTQTIDLGGIPVLLTRDGDGVHAVSAVCTHRGAPLAGAERHDGCITCPWHGSRFSLGDGHVVEGPATFGLAHFDTQIAGGAISLRAPAGD